MSKNTIDRSSAIKEINKWLEAIKFEKGIIIDESLPPVDGEEIPPSIHELSEDEEALEKQRKEGEIMLIEHVMDGHITFGDDFRLNIKLPYAIFADDGTTLVLEKLNFVNRLPLWQYNKSVKGIKDGDKRLLATISAFSNVASSRIDRMSTKEVRILQIIAGYLL